MNAALRRTAARLTPLAVAAATVAGLAGTATPARAAVSCPLGLTGHTVTPTSGAAFTMCSGRIPSFDGTPLDADVSLPAGWTGTAAAPLVVMMNGWGNSKTDFESTSPSGNGANTYDWNNVWFAQHGFAVLNYTARGFHRSCGKDPATGYSYLTDPACSGKASWTHLADRRWEIHDAQYLTGLLVDAHVASPAKVVATGDSYGGGQSWLLAMSQGQVMNPDGTPQTWTSPRGTPIRLAAAVPQFPWTDLAQALMENGHASDGYYGAPPDGHHTVPVGVEKQTYVDGLFALGGAYAQYSATDPTADLPAWFAAVSAGEPYEADPVIAQALPELTTYRSAYYLPVPSPATQVPVFLEQGLTDPLFPGIQASDMVRRLQAAYPSYPVWVTFGDLGHSYANNPHALWAAVNTSANTWLAQVLTGATVTQPRFTAYTVACEAGQAMTQYTATTLPGLAGAAWTASSTVSATLTNPTLPGNESKTADPITNAGCRTMATTTDSGVAAYSFSRPTAFTILGAPVVHLDVTTTAADSPELAVRLWDVDPKAGTQTLVTRTVYRIAASGPVAFELWPTAWTVQAGHQLKLELAAADSPTWRMDNLPAQTNVSYVALTVPSK